MVRTPKEIIDEAIRRNRFAEQLLYTFAIISFTMGIALIWHSRAQKSTFEAVLGVIVTTLILPPVASVLKVRKENMMLMSLELLLSQADTAKSAKEMLIQMFKKTFSEDDKDG